MMRLIDRLALSCRRCGKTTDLDVARLQESSTVRCAHCNAIIPIDKDRLARELAAAELETDRDGPPSDRTPS
jgi:hypothetical protein